MGRRRRKGRNVHGILPFDKPAGITSNGALQRVRRIYDARKAGHTGSLDMIATGLLPICMGEATKVSGFLLEADKRYAVSCRLGTATDTGDSAGKIILRRPVPKLTREIVETELNAFRGEIEQVPPMFSAIKHHGKRMYELARQGLEVERPARRVHVYELTLTDVQDDRLQLMVLCSKGTYVRTLVADLGMRLGCGAHVEALRRLQAGPFLSEQMVSLERLEEIAEEGLEALDAQLYGPDAALENYPEANLKRDVAWYLLKGQPVLVPQTPTDGYMRLYDEKRRFLGVGIVLDDGRIAPYRLLSLFNAGGLD